jgi:DNA mismatch repair ATPase MutS
MQISDSLVDGWSYFFAEVQCLKHLLAALESDHPLPLLYLIDELFRGTNNRERLIGSRAYIESLIGAYGTGLIATHDLELAGLASTSPLVQNYHFRDRVEGDRLVFDYQLRPGPCPSTNALRIMQMQGLPVRFAAGQPSADEGPALEDIRAAQKNSAESSDQQNLLSDPSKKN